MTVAWTALLTGIIVSILSSIALWYAARKCRVARPPSPWSSEGVATALSLALVGLVVIGGAWTIKGTLMLVPDAILGVGIGFLVVIAVMGVTMRILGRLPEAEEMPSVARPPAEVPERP